MKSLLAHGDKLEQWPRDKYDHRYRSLILKCTQSILSFTHIIRESYWIAMVAV